MNTIIYGASDDLIEVEGAISDELGIDCDAKTSIKVSDGTEANLSYDEDGNWRFDVSIAGSLLNRKVAAVGEDDNHTDSECLNASSYSDVLVFEDGVEWVKVGRKKLK